MKLTPKALTAEAFAPYGDVIEARGQARVINEGFTERFHDLAKVDVTAENGYTLVNIFRSQPKPLPIKVTMMERHPLGSQAFIPLRSTPFLVLVAPAEHTTLRGNDLELFITYAQRGVNYHRNVWHHYCLALEESDFLVIDRGGPGENLEEITLSEEIYIDVPNELLER